jgi:hypothetical protein
MLVDDLHDARGGFRRRGDVSLDRPRVRHKVPRRNDAQVDELDVVPTPLDAKGIGDRSNGLRASQSAGHDGVDRPILHYAGQASPPTVTTSVVIGAAVAVPAVRRRTP